MRETIESNLRYARFLATGAYLSAYKLRDGQALSAASILEENASRAPNGTAILFEDERITWSELDARANRFANAFRSLGLAKGDVVALLLDNRPEFLVATLGLNKVGGCAALLNTNLVGAALEHAITIGKPKFLVVGAEHVEKIAKLEGSLPVPRERIFVYADRGVVGSLPGCRGLDELLATASSANPGTTHEQGIKDPFLYIYTSGTTGLPKAAAVTTSRFLKAASIFAHAVVRLGPGDVVYGSGMPLYHSSGLILGFGSAFVVGAAFVVRRKFSASAHWDDCVRYGVTVFTYIGELCRYLLNAPAHPKERAHTVRAATGAGLRPDIWERFQSRFGIAKVFEFYGATEGNVGIFNVDGKPGMMGRLLPGQAVFTADPATGELLRDANGRAHRVAPGGIGVLTGRINRINQFDGYVDKSKNDQKVLRDPLGDGSDYFNTGDLVQLHERGYVSFRDRLGDTFRWKAENVSTNEVQELLNGCGGVAESNVYGVEVPGADGRAGMAALVVGPDFDLDAFARHVRSSLPGYARPIFVRVRHEMTTTGTFKHVKTDLKEQSYDPAKVEDALYFFESGERYVPMTPDLFRAIGDRRIRL